MFFAPQRRALFRHLNRQKWREHVVFCIVLYIFTSKCASRHNGVHFFDISTSKSGSKCASRRNGVQFFISHLASWLRTRRFGEPTFRPSGAPNHWKNTVFRDFPTFSRICIFFLLTLSLLLFSLLIFLFSLPLPCSAFHLSILSGVWLLNFLRWFLKSFLSLFRFYSIPELSELLASFCIYDHLWSRANMGKREQTNVGPFYISLETIQSTVNWTCIYIIYTYM